jgi:16S rRNA (guanine527-N7)-methyltransferase
MDRPDRHKGKPERRPLIQASAPLDALVPTPEFLAAAEKLGIVFEPGDLDLLGRFLAMMLETNKTTNLTAITDPAQAWLKHILDALTLVPAIASIEQPPPEEPNLDGIGPSLIDIGSGGGVPAMPLAIVMPKLRVTMVESTNKKADFLERVAAELHLPNTRVLRSRAEVIGHERPEHRERYDFATARALGHLAIVAELCGPLVRPGGVVIAVKGQKADQELEESQKAMGLLGLRHVETSDTPTGRLVILEKTTRTPRTYPRRVGEPARVPLGVPRAPGQ